MPGEHDEIVFDLVANTQGTQTSLRQLTIAAAEVMRGLENINRIAKDVLGIEMPKQVRDMINMIQDVIMTLKTLQMVARSTWATVTLGASLAIEAGVAAYQYATTPKPTETDKRVEG